MKRLDLWGSIGGDRSGKKQGARGLSWELEGKKPPGAKVFKLGGRRAAHAPGGNC